MPPPMGLRSALGRGRSAWKIPPGRHPSICFLCSLAPSMSMSTKRPRAAVARSRGPNTARRTQSTATTSVPTGDVRRELASVLERLYSHDPAGRYVNRTRLQLALWNLAQEAGKETIRVAVRVWGSRTGNSAGALTRLALADPLSPEQEWERDLATHTDWEAPVMVVHVGERGLQGGGETIEFGRSHEFPWDTTIREIDASSPALRKNRLDVLVGHFTNDEIVGIPSKDKGQVSLEDQLLAPVTVDEAMRPFTTAVHKTLLVADGLMGAVAVSPLVLETDETVSAAVDFPASLSRREYLNTPFISVNVAKGGQGLDLFRVSVGNAREYEEMWTEANISEVTAWLKDGTTSNEDGVTKEPVRSLIASILDGATCKIEDETTHPQGTGSSARSLQARIANLNRELSTWAQSAHEELQQQLDLAFTGRRWRKLGWWKLFWRVDDVGMLSSEMLAQRFLPEAERGVVYLAGRINEAVVTAETPAQSLRESGVSPSDQHEGVETPAESGKEAVIFTTPGPDEKWPTHIPHTRNYLQGTTVPALQALAQRLVMQSFSTSALTSMLGGLWYLSTFGAYESGAIAALGIVWSLGRLQKKWEAAREFWEGEVREEGRKAVRATEASVAEALDRARKDPAKEKALTEELEKARELVAQAQDALKRLK